ncbi:transcription termination factor 4, mitochondrial [Gastrophryne carolinensis]
MVSLCLRSLRFSPSSLCWRHVSSISVARQDLLDLGFSETQADWIRSMKCSAHSTSALTELCMIGLSHKMIMGILEKKPELLRTTAKELRDKADTLRSLGLGEGSLQNSVFRCPSLLAIPRSRLTAAAQCLKTRCQFSSHQLLKMLNTTPEALTLDPDQLEQLFQYVYFRMGGKQRDILSAGVFQSSLNEIKARHQFLERLGVFQPPNKNGQCPPTNPKIKDVVQLSEEDFISRVACSSLEEFAVFRKILEREEQEHAEDAEEQISSDEEDEKEDSETIEDSDDEFSQYNKNK